MTASQPDQNAEQAAFLLRLSARPVLLAGGGARAAGAGEELAALADKINAPLVTTWGGKSVVADDHPMSAGALFGQPETAPFLANADAVLAVGINFDEQAGHDLDLPAQMIQIDSDELRLGNRYPLRLGIAGDAKATLGAILAALEKPSPLKGAPGDRTEPADDAPTGDDREGAVRARTLREQVLARARKQGPSQMSALQSLRQAIDPQAITVGLPGSSIDWTAPFFEIKTAGTWMTGEDPAELFAAARDRSGSGPVVVFCDTPDLSENLAALQGCKALTLIGFLHGEKETKLMQDCLAAGFSTILVDTPTEIAAALIVMMPSGSPSAILASFRWDR